MNGPAAMQTRGDFASVRPLALAAIDTARELLAGYALRTDSPELGAVEAADYLDDARDALAGTP